jgi:hypothetical protein
MILAEMTTGNWIAILVPSGIAFLGALGTIIYRQGGLDKSVLSIDFKIDKLSDKFDNFLLSSYTQKKSPLQLNEFGLKIFKDPEIQEFVKSYYEAFKNSLIELKPESAYQAQERLLEIVDKLKFEANCQKKIENFAFNAGIQVEILLKVIAIGIRDQILSEIGFSPEEIDKTESRKTEQ